MSPLEVRATAELLHAKAASILRLAQDPHRLRCHMLPALAEAQQLLDSLKRGFPVGKPSQLPARGQG